MEFLASLSSGNRRRRRLRRFLGAPSRFLRPSGFLLSLFLPPPSRVSFAPFVWDQIPSQSFTDSPDKNIIGDLFFCPAATRGDFFRSPLFFCIVRFLLSVSALGPAFCFLAAGRRPWSLEARQLRFVSTSFSLALFVTQVERLPSLRQAARYKCHPLRNSDGDLKR